MCDISVNRADKWLTLDGRVIYSSCWQMDLDLRRNLLKYKNTDILQLSLSVFHASYDPTLIKVSLVLQTLENYNANMKTMRF